uniref:Uncharacterized protein n=1 Tax=Trichuris muris TaxID=70415 RepID=A0A5S6QVZ9_TRIMR
MSASERLNFVQICARFANDEMAVVQFMQGRGLMHDRRICPRCGRYMVLRSREVRDDVRCGAVERNAERSCTRPAKMARRFRRTEVPDDQRRRRAATIYSIVFLNKQRSSYENGVSRLSVRYGQK